MRPPLVPSIPVLTYAEPIRIAQRRYKRHVHAKAKARQHTDLRSRMQSTGAVDRRYGRHHFAMAHAKYAHHAARSHQKRHRRAARQRLHCSAICFCTCSLDSSLVCCRSYSAVALRICRYAHHKVHGHPRWHMHAGRQRPCTWHACSDGAATAHTRGGINTPAQRMMNVRGEPTHLLGRRRHPSSHIGVTCSACLMRSRADAPG